MNKKAAKPNTNDEIEIEIPPELRDWFGLVLEDACRAHLNRTANFPPEFMDALCTIFIALCDHVRSTTKSEGRGARAARAAEALAFFTGMSKKESQKLVAKVVKIEVDAVRQASRRIVKDRKKGGTK